jgi:hypothetical protein
VNRIGCASLGLYIIGGILLLFYGIVTLVFFPHHPGGTFVLGGWGNLVLGIVYLFLGYFISRESITAWVIAVIILGLQLTDGFIENIIVFNNAVWPNPGGLEPELFPVTISLIAWIALLTACGPIRAHEKARLASVEAPEGIAETNRPIVAGILATVAGILTVVAAAVLGFYMTTIPLVRSVLGIVMVVTPEPTVLFIGAVSIGIAAVAIVGGDQARKRQRWGLSLAGSICSLLCFLPLGIPAIILLTRSKAEFR